MTLIQTPYLFVYGTLTRQSGHDMHKLIAAECHYIADVYIQARLYDIGAYPAAVVSVNLNDKVYGELYKMHTPERLIPLLDDYEECSNAFAEPHEYKRQLLSTYKCSDNTTTRAWTYLYNLPIEDRPRIRSGNYANIKIKKN